MTKLMTCTKIPKYRAFLLPKSRKIYFDFHRWHWAVLAMCKDLNFQKSRSSPLQRSKYRRISILSPKNSIQSFRLGFSGFHEMWKQWNRVLFCFSGNQMIEKLSAICKPVWFSTMKPERHRMSSSSLSENPINIRIYENPCLKSCIGQVEKTVL